MDRLPDSILDTIYRYKHQLELKKVLDELTGEDQPMFFTTKLKLIRY